MCYVLERKWKHQRKEERGIPENHLFKVFQGPPVPGFSLPKTLEQRNGEATLVNVGGSGGQAPLTAVDWPRALLPPGGLPTPDFPPA